MLAALVTGVVMHRKLFRELFTFRPGKARLRSVLDLHNLTGVVALPFHFFFAFTGLMIFASVYYFPVGHTQLHQLHDLHEQVEAHKTGLPHERAGVPAGLANVDAMVAEAQRRWQANDKAGDVGFLVLQHVGDANGYVSVYRAGTDRIAPVGDGIHFRAATGELIREDPPATATARVSEFLTGLHLQHFRHWLLRWLYVLGGLSGAVCIATGFVFFVEKRKRQHALRGSRARGWSMRWRWPRSPAWSLPHSASLSPTACCRKACRRAATGSATRSGAPGCWRCCTRPGAAHRSPGATHPALANRAGRSPRWPWPRCC